MNVGGGQPKVWALCESTKRRPYESSPSFGTGTSWTLGIAQPKAAPAPEVSVRALCMERRTYENSPCWGYRAWGSLRLVSSRCGLTMRAWPGHHSGRRPYKNSPCLGSVCDHSPAASCSVGCSEAALGAHLGLAVDLCSTPSAMCIYVRVQGSVWCTAVHACFCAGHACATL